MGVIKASYNLPAVYNASANTLTDGQSASLTLDVNQNLLVSLATLIAGEDLTNNVLKVEERFSYTNITTDTTTTVKSGAGFLHLITINAPTATETITIYDNTAGSGTKIGTITIPASPMPVTLTYDVAFGTGLTLVTATATSDITVSYR